MEDQSFNMIIFWLVAVIFSASVHEFFHGLVALWQGDPTAKLMGRLTLNPMKHIDPIGSIAVPLLMMLTVGQAFGWAKPVPYNPYNLRNQRWGAVYVGLAGPAANFLIALIFGLPLRLVSMDAIAGQPIFAALLSLFGVIVLVNIILGLFNLMPIPPLDGSKLLFALMPPQWENLKAMLEQYGFVIALFFAFFVFKAFLPVIVFLFTLITGFGV